jgi:AcrR family transcriptional regulator
VFRDPASLTSYERILLAALTCFVEKGYHGTTVREIAARSDVSVPGLYHHFASKHAILERLIDRVMDDLYEETQDARKAAGSDPLARFDAVVCAHVRFHCERIEESFIGNSELRSLSSPARRRMSRKRHRQQGLFDEIIVDGAACGLFDLQLPLESSRALASMCTSVATWFRRDGSRSANEVVNHYRTLARDLVNYEAGAASRDPLSDTPHNLADTWQALGPIPANARYFVFGLNYGANADQREPSAALLTSAATT